MNNNFNPYHILSINKNASINDIKKAYKYLAKKYHPDKNKSYNDKFIKIQIAYEMLTETKKNEQLNNLNHNELKNKFNKDQDKNFKEIKINKKHLVKKNDKTLKSNLNKIKNKINSDFNLDKIADYPINENEFSEVINKYMKKRKIDSIQNIFKDKFELSIFNQIFNDLKNKNEIIIKEPVAFNEINNYKLNNINKKNEINLYKKIFSNNLNNPDDINIINKYKKNNNYIRDDIISDNYNKILEQKINAYKNLNLR